MVRLQWVSFAVSRCSFSLLDAILIYAGKLTDNLFLKAGFNTSLSVPRGNGHAVLLFGGSRETLLFVRR